MSENITFRSSISGFNRADVMEYIKTLMDESEEKSEKIRLLEEQIASKDELIAELNQKASNAALCENCDLAKQNEVKIGAAMLDAKRFSDFIVQEASEKADNMYCMACADAAVASEKALKLAEKITEDAESYSVVFTELSERMTELSEKLSAYGSETSDSKNRFDGSFENQESEKTETQQPSVEKKEEKQVQPRAVQTEDESFAPVFDFLDSVDDLVVKVNDNDTGK